MEMNDFWNAENAHSKVTQQQQVNFVGKDLILLQPAHSLEQDVPCWRPWKRISLTGGTSLTTCENILAKLLAHRRRGPWTCCTNQFLKSFSYPRSCALRIPTCDSFLLPDAGGCLYRLSETNGCCLGRDHSLHFWKKWMHTTNNNEEDEAEWRVCDGRRSPTPPSGLITASGFCSHLGPACLWNSVIAFLLIHVVCLE